MKRLHDGAIGGRFGPKKRPRNGPLTALNGPLTAPGVGPSCLASAVGRQKGPLGPFLAGVILHSLSSALSSKKGGSSREVRALHEGAPLETALTAPFRVFPPLTRHDTSAPGAVRGPFLAVWGPFLAARGPFLTARRTPLAPHHPPAPPEGPLT